jgi:soluble lytic murein transglycosylase-like protein
VKLSRRSRAISIVLLIVVWAATACRSDAPPTPVATSLGAPATPTTTAPVAEVLPQITREATPRAALEAAAHDAPVTSPPARVIEMASLGTPLLEAAPTPTMVEIVSRSEHPLWEARRLLWHGDFAAAASAYEKAISAGETSPQVFLEYGQVQVRRGDLSAARATFLRLLAANPNEPDRSRANLLLAATEIGLDDWQSALARVDVSNAPDGLTDLVALRRAEAAARGSDSAGARDELARPELRASTNRSILEDAGWLAVKIGEHGLAGDLLSRAATFPGWSAERSRVAVASAEAYERAGNEARAIDMYRYLVESFGWLPVGRQAGKDLARLGGDSPFYRGLIAVNDGQFVSARSALAEAASDPRHADRVSRLVEQVEESIAWRAAVDSETAEAFRSFLVRFPRGTYAAEARFQMGLLQYQAGQLVAAARTWDEAAPDVSGDDRARMHFWSAKAQSRLGHDAEATARLRAAEATRPSGYYSVRAGDLLADRRGWPSAETTTTANHDAGNAEAREWLAEWAGQKAEIDPAARARIGRGIGLAGMGMRYESTAEFNALIDEVRDGWLLLELAELLADQELWFSSSRAAGRLVALSPTKSSADVPAAIRRLVYPDAYGDLIRGEAKRYGIDPLFVQSLMFQESRFDPAALSIAEARGLTQVIPSTGRGIASALGWRDFSPVELYRPVVAVQFGAWYLANQLKSFGGDPFYAMAAYNAGGGPISRWAASDTDLFIERIDYPETRKYVRQVYFHHAVYRGLDSR